MLDVSWQLDVDDDVTGMADEVVVMVAGEFFREFPPSVFAVVNEATDHSHFFKNCQISVRGTLGNAVTELKKLGKGAWPGLRKRIDEFPPLLGVHLADLFEFCGDELVETRVIEVHASSPPVCYCVISV
jgi:hypothetical protein